MNNILYTLILVIILLIFENCNSKSKIECDKVLNSCLTSIGLSNEIIDIKYDSLSLVYNFDNLSIKRTLKVIEDIYVCETDLKKFRTKSNEYSEFYRNPIYKINDCLESNILNDKARKGILSFILLVNNYDLLRDNIDLNNLYEKAKKENEKNCIEIEYLEKYFIVSFILFKQIQNRECLMKIPEK